MKRPRGPYLPYGKYGASGVGGFVLALRRQRNMTQAQYADFLGCSLRTLVTAEKTTYRHAPYTGTAVGYGLANKEFQGEFEMRRAFGEFLQKGRLA